jgi:hypothetical protein
MGIPLVLFGKENEIGFSHLLPRPRNCLEQLTRVVFKVTVQKSCIDFLNCVSAHFLLF